MGAKVPDDREDTTAESAPLTTPEMPAVGANDDDEATRVDPQPPKAKPAAAAPPKPSKSKADDDDEATQARPPPKKVLAERALLEASRRMNASPEDPKKKKAKKLHPLIPLGTAFALLALLLLLVNWFLAPEPTPSGEAPPSGGIRKMFDW